MMKTSFRISRVNLILLCATALGVGALWSFVIFYSAFKQQCHSILVESEIQTHQAEMEWKKKYEEAMENGGGGGKCKPDKKQQPSRELVQLQQAMQRRNRAECILKYGEGPYAVKLTLSLPESLNIVIGIEFPSADSMPHTVWTFLSLVESRFYYGTTLASVTNKGILVGGNPEQSSAWVKSTLLKRYAEHGYDSHPFLIRNEAPLNKHHKAPCVENSFGIVNDGPDFALYLKRSADTSLYCPGTVVEGVEHLQVLEALLENQRATIVEAKVVPNLGFGMGNEL